MKKHLVALAVLSSASMAVADGIIYDGFNYDATNNPFLGTPSVVAAGFGKWVYQGNAVTEPHVTSGSLNYPGLPASLGNSVYIDNHDGVAPTGAGSARLYFGSVDKTSTATLYYSFVTSIPSSASTNQNGAFFAGLDSATNGATYDTFGGLFVRQDATNPADIDLGISTQGTAGGAGRKFSGELPHDTLLYVVVGFSFAGPATLDVYTNPASVPFIEPTTHLVTSGQSETSSVSSITNLYLRGNTGSPQTIKVDEVRVGTTFADVASHALYWDINGTDAGSGGTAPSGAWDGSATNFNTDPTGGAGGTIVASPASLDGVSFAAGNDAIGSYTVSVGGTRSAGTLYFTSGSVALTGGALKAEVFDVAAGASGNIGSAIIGSAAVTKTGLGALTLAAPNTYASGTNVVGGSLIISNASSLGGGAVSVSDGASLTAGSGLGSAISVGRVTISGSGKFDLNDNTLMINYTGTSPLATVRGYLASGFNAGNWNGAGLNSTVAHNDPNFLSALGYSDSGTVITVKFTHYGDNNLDGLVDTTDFQMFLDGFVTAGASTWSQGDYTYDGKVDLGNDFNLFVSSFLHQGGTLGDLEAVINADDQLSADQKSTLLASVPEPTLIAPACIAGLFGIRRRNKIRSGSLSTVL